MTQTPFTSTLACTQAAKQLDQLQQHDGQKINSLTDLVDATMDRKTVAATKALSKTSHFSNHAKCPDCGEGLKIEKYLTSMVIGLTALHIGIEIRCKNGHPFEIWDCDDFLQFVPKNASVLEPLHGERK